MEEFPLGTNYRDMTNALPQISRYEGRIEEIGSELHTWLLFNPYSKGDADMRLYRQWPRGILMDLRQDDFRLAPHIAEGLFGIGELFVLFDHKMNYKGYFAHSNRSKDSKQRFGAEKLSYKELGFIEEYERAEVSVRIIGAEPQRMSELPQLPLSGNKARDAQKAGR